MLSEEEAELPVMASSMDSDTQLGQSCELLWVVPPKKAADKSVEHAICLVACAEKTINCSGQWVRYPVRDIKLCSKWSVLGPPRHAKINQHLRPQP